LAEAYVQAVADLRDRWRQRLADSASGRSRPQTYQGIEQLVEAGVLQPISESSRNRAWEATGLLELIAALEAGRLPGR